MANKDYRVLTDTDIFGYQQQITDDKYQLIYGIFKYSQLDWIDTEACLYNLTASLLNKYKAPMLREMKIKGWMDAISVVEVWCRTNAAPNSVFIVPFLNDEDKPTTIDNLLTNVLLVKETLNKAKDNYTPDYPIETLPAFRFPLPPIVELLLNLRNDYLAGISTYDENDPEEKAMKQWCISVAEGIEWEMYNRGFWNGNTDFFDPNVMDEANQGMYDIYLLHRTPDEKEYKPENVEDAKELTIKQRVGVIFFMLECFGVKDKEQVRKLAHFVVKDKEPYKAKTNSNDTIYSILHNDKQIFKLTPYFKETLKRYGLPIPQGLEDLDKREFD